MELNNLDIKMNQYINGELKGEALEKFEQLLSSDSKLAKEVALHKKIDQTLKAKKSGKNEVELKKLFQQFGEKYILKDTENKNGVKIIDLNKNNHTANESTNIGILRWLAPIVGLAAAALLILFIGFGEVDPKQLAQQYFEPTIVDFTSRSGDMNTLTSAQQAYDGKDYRKALTMFSKFPENNRALIAKGNCEFLLDKPDEAVKTFKLLVGKKIDVHQKAQAQWYLALSYLKLNNITGAKNSFELILKDSKYYKDAQAILKKLD